MSGIDPSLILNNVQRRALPTSDLYPITDVNKQFHTRTSFAGPIMGGISKCPLYVRAGMRVKSEWSFLTPDDPNPRVPTRFPLMVDWSRPYTVNALSGPFGWSVKLVWTTPWRRIYVGHEMSRWVFSRPSRRSTFFFRWFLHLRRNPLLHGGRFQG